VDSTRGNRPLTVTGSDHYVVISSDNHCGADLLDYKPYLERRWHDEFDVWAKDYANPWEFMDPRVRGMAEDNTIEADTPLIAASSWNSVMSWDNPRRIRHMEADGIVAEVLFPNTAPPFLPTSVLSGAPPATREEYDRRWAGLRAHNRWLVDFCAELPGRRAGVAQIMLYDIDDAVEEVKWVRKVGLTGGVILPMDGSEGGQVPVYSPDYEPLWDICEELQVPVHKHASTPGGRPKNERTPKGILAIGLIEGPFYQHRCLGQLIFAGVFERHPRLRFVMTESTSGWVSSYLQSIDDLFVVGRNDTGPLLFLRESLEELTMLPSEYFYRNCFLGSSLLLRSEVEARSEIGISQMMWGADYPHAEGSFPYSRESLRLLFHDVPIDECRAILGGTAAQVYGFDLDDLQKVANRVCMTVDEVAAPLVDIPRVPEDTYAMVFNEVDSRQGPLAHTSVIAR
jgi:predicted TIM-barrel fold metal-dependent hydrolase